MTKQETIRSGQPRTAVMNPPQPSRSKKRVLVVDDEKDLVDLITYNLGRNGYEFMSAYNGGDALEIAQRDQPDLILLDLMLPGLDGTEVARRLKSDSRTAQIPIIMLTAKSEETDEVVGLTIGADDYITKPFSIKVVLARINGVLRRAETPQINEETGTLKAGPLSIDSARHEVTVNKELVRLTLTEFKLLSALVTARGRVLTRDQLMDKAMGTDVFVTDRAIDVHITAIRKKLGDASWLVHTVRGVGYRLQETPGEPE
ncbi:MAG TPA: response regulator transcription factor [Tepidisphaeraceae bacterium]|nr:response regulator transcription factor [Tepidisphaeraceae bacterium]